ncbi:ABC transporter permease subunit [Mycoplasma amphoriforme]|uniref:ABC transmembrane type-1 domain-containing protein n=1 Tax=Mycoplasma amphoriforme A39 TaxID=572419 RepID=A0A292IIV3_9MOLU|nr:unnamed protein product [Mycoplasma amphoriforme A39]
MVDLDLNKESFSSLQSKVRFLNIDEIKKGLLQKKKIQKINEKNQLKKQIQNAKSKYFNYQLALKSLNRDFQNQLKVFKNHALNQVQLLRKSFLTVNGINLELELQSLQREVLYFQQTQVENIKVKELQTKCDVIKKQINSLKTNSGYVEKVKVIENNLQEKIARLKNDFFVGEKSKKRQLKLQVANELKSVKKVVADYKTTYYQKLKEHQTAIRAARKQAAIDYVATTKLLRQKNLYVNSYNELVQEINEIEKKYQNLEPYLAIANAVSADSTYGRKIKKAAEQLKKQVNKKGFETVVKQINLTNKITTYEQILRSWKKIDEQILDAQNQLAALTSSSVTSSELTTLQSEHQKTIEKIRKNRQNLSKKAYQNLIREKNFRFKIDKKELENQNEQYTLKEKIRFLKLTKIKQKERLLKIMYTSIDDEVKKIPTKAFKNSRWLAMFLSLLVPGLGQFLNKEYFKGIGFLIGSLFIYALALPFFFGVEGYHSQSGGGIFGLSILSPVQSTDPLFGTIYLDARFRIIEGLISLFLLIYSLLIYMSGIYDARRSGFYREYGYRPKNIRDLKTFLAGTGLPLVISLPAFVLITFVVALPVLATFLLAFTDYNFQTQPPGNALNYNGGANFVEVFSGAYSASFAYVSGWTVIWTLVVTVGIVIIGTTLALILDNPRIQGKSFWKTVYILPWAVPAFATILFFSASFIGTGTNTYYNQFFGSNVAFAQSEFYTRLLLIVIQIWLGHSYVFMLVSGIKKSISEEIYEAASIDGSNRFRTLMSITAPLILQQVAPLLVGQFIFNFNNFGLIFLFSSGGPVGPSGLPGNPGATDIIISLIFNLTTSNNNQIGLASAFTIIMSVVIVAVSATLFLKSKAFKREL